MLKPITLDELNKLENGAEIWAICTLLAYPTSKVIYEGYVTLYVQRWVGKNGAAGFVISFDVPNHGDWADHGQMDVCIDKDGSVQLVTEEYCTEFFVETT